MGISQNGLRNAFLRTLNASDFALIAKYLAPVKLPRRKVLIEEHRPITHVYFPDSGLCSIVAVTPQRETITVGCFGRDGSTNFVLDAGKDRVPLRTYVQIEGEGWRIEAAPFAAALASSHTFMKLTTRFDQIKALVMAYTALSHGSYTIPERLARWLLMYQDRVGDDLPIVHDALALTLAVRRSGVTEAIHALETRGAILSSRGSIEVIDRDMLIELAAGSYGVPEAEYRRVIGPWPD